MVLTEVSVVLVQILYNEFQKIFPFLNKFDHEKVIVK